MQKYFLILILMFILCSCNESNNKRDNNKTQIITSKENLNPPNSFQKKPNDTVYIFDTLATNNVLVNGKKIILTLNEFRNAYSKIDSTESSIWECGNPFEWLDEDWMNKKYGDLDKYGQAHLELQPKIQTIYYKNLEFVSNKHLVLFKQAKSLNNTFEIISHHIVLTSNTSIKDFKKIFKKCTFEKTELKRELRVRFILDKQTEDAFIFNFKDGKLAGYELWWLLC